jgi:hypothetical protein
MPLPTSQQNKSPPTHRPFSLLLSAPVCRRSPSGCGYKCSTPLRQLSELEAGAVYGNAQKMKEEVVCLKNCWFGETAYQDFCTTGGNVAKSLLFVVMDLQ